MSDAELLLELTEAVRSNRTAPVLEQQFDPTNPVEIEIVMHEADFMIEGYMAKWSSFRARFDDPSIFDAFVLDYQMRVRKDLKGIISAAQQYIADSIESNEENDEDEPDAHDSY